MNLIWVFEAFDDNNKSEGKFGIYCNGKKLATKLIDERIRKRFDHHVNIKFVDGYDDKRKDDDATRVKKVLDLFHEGLVIL